MILRVVDVGDAAGGLFPPAEEKMVGVGWPGSVGPGGPRDQGPTEGIKRFLQFDQGNITDWPDIGSLRCVVLKEMINGTTRTAIAVGPAIMCWSSRLRKAGLTRSMRESG